MEGVTRTITGHVLAGPDLKLHVHPEGSRPFPARKLARNPRVGGSISGYHFAVLAEPSVAGQVLALVGGAPELFPGGWFLSPRLSRSYALLLPPNENGNQSSDPIPPVPGDSEAGGQAP
jgi:hypothetical protein